MKKKQKYSLTAKERKAARRAGLEPIDNRPAEEIAAGQAEAEAAKKRKRSLIKRISIVSGAVLVAAALIVTAILLPIYVERNKYSHINNPVAVVTLDNGMTLRYEVYESTCPIGATNFLYLAKIGYFNGAIIFDSQNNWVRFGGFTGTKSTDHRENDMAFAAEITDLNERGTNGKKFTYRLQSDTSADAKRTTERGALCYLTNTTTEFQVPAIDNAQTTVPNTTSTLYSSMTAVGRCLDDETLGNIATIVGYARKTSGSDLHSWWRAPIVSNNPETLIRIQSVKLYNLNKSKWKKFNFETYMATANNGNSAIR